MVMKSGLSAGLSESAAAHADAVEALRRMKKVRLDAAIKFRGVRRRRRRPRSGKFGAQIWDPLRQNNLWLGTFDSEVDAARAYDAAAAELHGALAQYNFNIPAAEHFQEHGLSAGHAEERGGGVEAVVWRKEKAVRRRLRGPLGIAKDASTVKLRCARESKRCLKKKQKKKEVKKGAAGPYSRTGFWGVRTQSTGRYGAEIRDNKGKTYTWLGTFDTPEEAARVYDAAAVKLHGASANINFKISLAVQSSESVTAEGAQGQGLSAGNCEITEELVDAVKAVERRRKKTVVKKETVKRPNSRTGPNSKTGFWGVRTQSSGKFGAEISFKGKGCTWLGTFDTAEEAARAYDAAAVKLHGASAKTNFKIPTAVQSSESVTAEGAQGQGLSAGNCEIVDELGVEAGRMKIIDGGPHRRWSMWFNSMQSEEPYQGAVKRMKKTSPDVQNELRCMRRRLSSTAEDATAVKLPCVKKALKEATCRPYSRTGFWGVRRTRTGRYGAEIRDNKGKTYRWLGTFDTPEEAARVYDAAAVELHGASANINFKIPVAGQSSESVTADSAQGQGLNASNCEIAEELVDGASANINFKIPVAVQSSESVTADSAQGQGLNASNCEIAEEPVDGASANINFKIPVAVQSSESVTADSAQGQGLNTSNCEVAEEPVDGASANINFSIPVAVQSSDSVTADNAQGQGLSADICEITEELVDGEALESRKNKLHGVAAKTSFKIPVAVQSSTSVTLVPAESAQGQGLSAGNCDITGEHRESVEAVERRKEKVLLDAQTEFTAEDAAAVKLPCRKKKACRLDSRTGFRGVRRRPSGRFVAEIIRDKVCRRLGTFDAAEEAARAYDAAAIELHGAAAKTNFKSPSAPVADDIDPGLVQEQTPVAVKVNSNVEGRRSAVARSDSRSGFRGVRLYRGKYLVQIREPQRPTTRRQLGIFNDVEEAAKAYDAAALKLYGSAAKTNFGQPLKSTTADDGESSMDLLNDLPKLPVRSSTISVGAEVEEFLKGFTADVA